MNEGIPTQNEDEQEDSSSQGSFMDATQTQEDSIDDTAQSKSPKDATPVRILKDMEFLKNSWAHMTKNNKEEDSLSTKSPPNAGVSNQLIVDQDGFQLKLSKGQKKAQKRLNQLSKDTYSTSSKVLSRPFKWSVFNGM